MIDCRIDEATASGTAVRVYLIAGRLPDRRLNLKWGATVRLLVAPKCLSH
jgi:hypothetical protein